MAGFAAEMCSRKQSYVPRIALGTGGDAVNCAAAFQKFGGSAAICGRIGNDLQGRALTDALQRCGVDTHALVIDPQRGTGTVVNLIQGDNEASYVASLGANAAFCDADVPDELLRQAKLVCVNSLFGCGALTAEVLRRADRCGHDHAPAGRYAFADRTLSCTSGLLSSQHGRGPAAHWRK